MADRDESIPTDEPPQRRSSISRMMDAIKKPFHHEKKETTPALQEAIDKMEARKAGTHQLMEEEGKDPNLLSAKRTDIANPLK